MRAKPLLGYFTNKKIIVWIMVILGFIIVFNRWQGLYNLVNYQIENSFITPGLILGLLTWGYAWKVHKKIR